MYELIGITDKCHYIECPSRIGVVETGDGEVCFIDSGIDRSAAKRTLRAISERGFRLKAVYNTHSHADHVGGNRYLCEQTGCKIYAPSVECCSINHTFLEPALLYGGNPMPGLKGKFMIAEESPALPLTEGVLPECMMVVDLPGHTPGMVGYIVSDGTAYIGDAIAPESTLNKYGVFYLYDVAAYLESLCRLESLNARVYLLSHSAPLEDIGEIVNYNRQRIAEICDKIAEICDTGKEFDEILGGIFEAYGLEMTVEQYALIGSTVRSYLSYLTDIEKIKAVIEDNRLKWQKS